MFDLCVFLGVPIHGSNKWSLRFGMHVTREVICLDECIVEDDSKKVNLLSFLVLVQNYHSDIAAADIHTIEK